MQNGQLFIDGLPLPAILAKHNTAADIIKFAEVIANCDHLEKLKFSRTNPYAFTEHGTIMLANVLNTKTAIKTSVLIVRAFVKLRELLSTHKELERKILELESKYDKQFQLIFEAIRELMHQEQLDKNRPAIGFKRGKEK